MPDGNSPVPSSVEEYSPEEQTVNTSEIEAIKQLQESFIKVASIADPLHREYKLALLQQEASHYNLSPESYRCLFEVYCQQVTLTRSKPFNKCLKPFSWIEMRLENVLDWLKSLAILEILRLLGNTTVLIAVIVFITEEPKRRNAAIREAWQVINTASGKSGNGGRKEALEFLNSQPRRNPLLVLRWERQSLGGLEAPRARLYQVKLPNADLAGANLEEADLSESKLQGVYLWEANLRKANLTEAQLQGADLSRANLSGANLANANLEGAKLEKTNLQGAKYTHAKTTLNTCKEVFLIERNYPCTTTFPKDFDFKAAGMKPLD